MFANMVYARLAAGCADEKDRQRLDHELAAPLIGWEAAQRNLMRAIASAPDPVTEG